MKMPIEKREGERALGRDMAIKDGARRDVPLNVPLR
jgi:hypothetical protein